MPKLSPKEFFRQIGQPEERWCFTAYELKHPERCRGDDPFVAMASEQELGVVVRRNGTVLNQWEDGTAGVPDEVQQLADEEETLRKPVYLNTRNLAQNEWDEETVGWQDVFVKADGAFGGFSGERIKRPGPGAELADALLDADQSRAAARFLKSLNDRPVYVKELSEMGWNWRKAGEKMFAFDLSDFYLRGFNMPGKVRLYVGEYGGDLIGVSAFDMRTGCEPSGVRMVRWEDLKPRLLAWQNALKFDLPGQEHQLPDYTDFCRNWKLLKRDLKACETQVAANPKNRAAIRKIRA